MLNIWCMVLSGGAVGAAGGPAGAAIGAAVGGLAGAAAGGVVAEQRGPEGVSQDTVHSLVPAAVAVAAVAEPSVVVLCLCDYW